MTDPALRAASAATLDALAQAITAETSDEPLVVAVARSLLQRAGRAESDLIATAGEAAEHAAAPAHAALASCARTCAAAALAPGVTCPRGPSP